MEKNLKGSNQSLLSKEVFDKFFTKENISNFFVQFRVIFSWLALLWATQVFNNQINATFDEVKYSANRVINQYTSFNFNESESQEIQKIFHKVQKEFWETNIEDEKFREKLYHEIKNYDKLNGTKLLQSLLLWFLYFFAYMKTINRVKDDFMKIDVQSFTTFSLTSWAMVFVNWLVPWSLVYAESFFLAWWAVLLHFRNYREWKTQENKFFNSFIDENPLPIVAYNKNWKPTLWNKKMEEETWYSYSEILEYHTKNGEVMNLLYKWENLQKVIQYLTKIKETWEWYKNIAFKMNTKSWEEKTFLWTTLPDWHGWTIRTARLLTDEIEIKEELQRTKELLNSSYKEIDQIDDKEKLEKLDEAIIEDRIVPFFQPIYYTDDTSKIYKYEVLMRVKNKNWWVDAPWEYLDTAKKYNRLVSIFNIIFKKVFELAQNNDIKFSINLSGQDIANPELINVLTSWVLKYWVDPSRITLEILEWEWNWELNHLDIITEIKSKRFRIAMDDFGSDNSNLNRLLDLLNNKQIDELKIDWHIIKYLIEREKSMLEEDIHHIVKLSILTKEILRWIISACHKAWILVVAEFVENEEILQECKNLDIDFLQWFYLSKPLEKIN